MLTIAVLVLVDYVLVDSRSHNWSDVVFVATLIVPPYVFGRIVRRLADQKRQLEDQQELVRHEAVRAERDRIARELHDVIAHSVSAMVVQTAAAQDLVRHDPDRAEEVLADVADTGRRALAETGRLLHVIRDDADELGLSPAPGLADLPALVERFRASGLTVDLDVREPLPSLPAGVDVSAYRIVQESLTNALRYAADRTAALTVSGTPRRRVDQDLEPDRDPPGWTRWHGQRAGPAGHGRAGLRARRAAHARRHAGSGSSWPRRCRWARHDPGRGRRRPGPGPLRPRDGAGRARRRGRGRGGRRSARPSTWSDVPVPTWC